MLQRYFHLALLIFIFGGIKGYAQAPFLLTVGQECYHYLRVREGGTFQRGRMDGARLSIEGLNTSTLYLGVDYLYATGKLRGKSATGLPILSTLQDEIFELRLGFTLRQPFARSFITPFTGWGMFREINDFHPPSPLPYTFTDRFNYLAVGFLSGVNFAPMLSMGINFKLKFMQEASSKVTNDPLRDDVTLMMKEEIHVRFDVPLTYSPPRSWLFNAIALTPFYEYRHFGGREGFPYNFRDTKFYLYGARLSLIHSF